jgi:hypothetical protein
MQTDIPAEIKDFLKKAEKTQKYLRKNLIPALAFFHFYCIIITGLIFCFLTYGSL